MALLAALLGTTATLLVKAAPPASPPAQQPSRGRPDRALAPGEHLPKSAIARMGSPHLRHGDAVYFAAYTPDGKALLTAGRQ